MNDQLALAHAGYQPMEVGLDFLNAVPANANAKLVQSALRQWSGLYDDMDSNSPTRAALANRVVRTYGPRLQQLGFAPQEGEPAVDELLR